MPTTYIYVFKWFKVSKKTRKTSEVCKKPVLQNKTGGCYVTNLLTALYLSMMFDGIISLMRFSSNYKAYFHL